MRKASGLHPNFVLLTKDFVHKAQEAGYIVQPYTINESEDWERMIEYGVDAIITDWPERAFTLLKNKELLIRSSFFITFV